MVIAANHPEVYQDYLLIRLNVPEEVRTCSVCSVRLLPLHLTRKATEHVRVAMIVLEKAKRLVKECGHDVVYPIGFHYSSGTWPTIRYKPACRKVLSVCGIANARLHKPKTFLWCCS